MQNPEAAVTSRSSEGAQARQDALCCPITFNPEHLRVPPEEIIERAYGRDALEQVYRATLEGSASPAQGNIVSLWDHEGAT